MGSQSFLPCKKLIFIGLGGFFNLKKFILKGSSSFSLCKNKFKEFE